MKKVFLAMALLMNFNPVFAQDAIEISTAITLSPFATATKLIESAVITVMSPFATTLASTQNRGVAGKEQLKDELVALNEDMMGGQVKRIQEVRQPALRELFEEISADQVQMDEINSVIVEGSDLHRIATAVTVTLMLE
jgi:glutamine synthetase type III